MAESVRRRGPDDVFAWAESGIAMATRRLAIVDPSQGRQPLMDAEGRVVVACNGELFDHVAQRRALAARGHVFRTGCDTELWPALYLDHGARAFERAHGQFAVAIWDRTARRLLLARDRIGICPLHYAIADGWLLFGSEAKAILASGLVPAEADLEGIDHVFSLFARGTERTCLRGVRAVKPGHVLDVVEGDVRSVRYWDIDFPDLGMERREPSVDALTDELHATLRAAVARRIEGETRVAAYLSGGLDSAIVLSLARSLRGGDAPTAFTVGFDRSGPDERARTTRAASLLGASLDTVVVSPRDIVDALPEVVEAAEGPIMDMADACVLLLARRVRERGFKAVLTGEGADEGMAGYVWHKVHRVLAALGRVDRRLPDALRRLVFSLVRGDAPEAPFAARLRDVRPSMLDLYEPLSFARARFYSDAMMDRLRDHDPFRELDVDEARMRRWHPLNRSLYLEHKLMLPGHLLLDKGDRMAMRSSVESRYPFLDERVLDFTRTLAPELKLGGFREKWLLRELGRRILPEPIASPPKAMFRAHSLCMLGPLPAWVDELLCEESLRNTGYFSHERVARERLLQRRLPSFSPHRIVSDGAFTAVVTTQLFHHLFLGGGLCSLPTWSPT